MKHILTAVLTLAILTGCASPQGPQTTPLESAAFERGKVLVREAIPYMKIASAAAVKLALKYAEEDSVKREELTLQIHTVAVNLELLLVRKQFSPDQVTDALKVKEEYVNTVLEAIGVLYGATYNKLAADDNATLAIEVLEALALGVKAGTS